MRRRRQRGGAAIEFALILPVFFLLLMGLLDWGFYFFVDLATTNAAREGARAAVTIPGVCGSAGAAEARALGESTAQSYMARIGQDGSSTVTVSCVSAPPLSNPSWQVDVVVDFPLLTGFLRPPLIPASPAIGKTRARATSVMRGVQ